MSITSRLDPRTPSAKSARRLDGDLIRCVRRAIDRVLHWRDLARQRRALLELDDHMLKDIGLSRYDARLEARRPFWDDPGQTWLR